MTRTTSPGELPLRGTYAGRSSPNQRSNASWHIRFCPAVPLMSVRTMSSPDLKWKASSMLMRRIVRT